MGRLGTETAFETLAKAKALEAQGRDIVHLEIGEPDFDTPVHIRNAAKKALDDGFTHYGPSPGLPEARAAIARHQTDWQGYEVSPDNVVFTPGGKPVMFFTIMALIDEGDEVIYPNPGFPIYESMINFMGGTAVPLKLAEESGLRRRRGRTAVEGVRPHQVDNRQLSEQPLRQRDTGGRSRADGRQSPTKSTRSS